MKKALFILHEGIGATIFNSQVLVHSQGMLEYKIDFDILSYDTLGKTWALSNKNLSKINDNYPEINIQLKKGLNIYYPFSSIYNLFLLVCFLLKNRNKYSFIHARADYTAFLCILSKPFHRLPVFWDCRGDAVSELKDSLSRKNIIIKIIGRVYLVTFDRFAAYINCKFCDGAIFVSEALYELFKSNLKAKNYAVIPCPVSEKKFFFDVDLRNNGRSSLKISEEKQVYLYSGSMVSYQSLHEQYIQYEALLKEPNNIIIIATSDPDIAKNFFRGLNSSRLIITSVSFEEMNLYYNISDFAFLMREKKRLNYVASPTKFGEYCLCGLPVIMNDTVHQSYTISKLLGNYISASTKSNKSLSEANRVSVGEKSKQYFSREVLNASYFKLYKTKIV